MIPITINKKKYDLKAIWELTTREFIELSKIKDIDIQKYIAWQLSLDADLVFFAKISPAIEAAIGVAPDITTLIPCTEFDLKKGIDTLGQRHQIEQCNKKDFELLVFTLAVSQAQSMNIDDVTKLYDKYMGMEFYKILPTGFFFFNRSRHGKNSVLENFRKHLELIKIKKSKKRLALRG
jgi:hypothetical protein